MLAISWLGVELIDCQVEICSMELVMSKAKKNLRAHTLRVYGGVEVQLHFFLISVLEVE